MGKIRYLRHDIAQPDQRPVQRSKERGLPGRVVLVTAILTTCVTTASLAVLRRRLGLAKLARLNSRSRFPTVSASATNNNAVACASNLARCRCPWSSPNVIPVCSTSRSRPYASRLGQIARARRSVSSIFAGFHSGMCLRNTSCSTLALWATGTRSASAVATSGSTSAHVGVTDAVDLPSDDWCDGPVRLDEPCGRFPNLHPVDRNDCDLDDLGRLLALPSTSITAKRRSSNVLFMLWLPRAAANRRRLVRAGRSGVVGYVVYLKPERMLQHVAGRLVKSSTS